MYIRSEISDLYHFDAWGGAVSTKEKICEAGLGEDFISALEELYYDCIDDVELNDLLWFESEFCLHLVDLKTDEKELFEDEEEAQDKE